MRSKVFQENQDYVRRQIVYCLLQEDEVAALQIIAGFLLFDGRHHDQVYEMMNSEGAFGRLVEVIREGKGMGTLLHRWLLTLLYEMCRIHRLHKDDLALVDDEFVKYLLQIIEQLSEDVDDPYHYPVIRVLVWHSLLHCQPGIINTRVQLVLNEQYMIVSASSPTSEEPDAPLTNRVIKVLSVDGPSYMTFGENIILLLNRETETSLQLLILKVLYLLFTTAATQEYFYTNDLRVLLDVIIRNLLDLPDSLTSLRHTYLRVLYPLLAFTQLREPPHYKVYEIIKVLGILGGSSSIHFAPVDETTLRLVERVAKVPWLHDEEISKAQNYVAKKSLGMSLSPTEGASSVSVVAAVMEKPGVQTPSRKDGVVVAEHLEEASPSKNSERGEKKEEEEEEADTEESVEKTCQHPPRISPPRIVKIPPAPPPLRVVGNGGKALKKLSTVNGGANGIGSLGADPNAIEGVATATLTKAKKLPPKAPPRRRTRRVVSAEEAS